jgi:hypothetical protein
MLVVERRCDEDGRMKIKRNPNEEKLRVGLR